MSSVSLFEQLTSSVSLSMLGIVSGAILALLLVYTIACRLFFSSSKSKDTSSNKDKKSNTKQKQGSDTTSSNKKKNIKAKKNVDAISSSLPTTQSEESENEKAKLVAPTKKSTPPSKVSTGKKVAAGENNKPSVSTNEIKTSSTKQQQAPVRAENVEGKKQSKTGTSNKQQTPGKSDTVTKVTPTNLNKKQPVAVNSEAKRTPTVDGDAGSDQEDDGQWVTQSSKQVNNRNRNKGKTETSSTNNQTSPSALLNRNVVSEKRPVVTTSNGNISSTTNKNEFDIEPTIPSIQNQEPIEICQLLPTNANRYTDNDNWWKQALNKQQTFSVEDIGEWPEREQDEQYTVQIKRIIPVKKVNEEQDDYEP